MPGRGIFSPRAVSPSLRPGCFFLHNVHHLYEFKERLAAGLCQKPSWISFMLGILGSFPTLSLSLSFSLAGPHHIFPNFHSPIPVDVRHHEGRYHYEPHALHALHGAAGLGGSPVISDISLIRLSPGSESSFLPPHSYVSPHVEHYLRSAHSSPSLSMISAARGLSPAD
ncbi:zinc finger protein GLI2-like, partial [Carassius auratus]|uniref:Zinc finger protein GLI2-like n=1 Tax=Carassius auratus TaxID=7957 RepID=A0A6P6PIJ2_CARAU